MSSARGRQAQYLAIAKRNFEFYLTNEGVQAAPRKGPNIVMPVGEGAFTDRLTSLVFEECREVPAGLDAICRVIRGDVLSNQQPLQLPLRVGEMAGRTVIDLAHPQGLVVVLDDGGWKWQGGRTSIPFRRSVKQAPLPVPLRGHTGLAELRRLVNVREEDWPLVLAWMVSTFLPGIDHPVLWFAGPEGSAKTGAMEAITSITDPSLGADGKSFGTTSCPDPKDWATVAGSSWCLTLDNATHLTQAMSDNLCRAVTGDTVVRRRLYTDADTVVVRIRCCIVISAITLTGIRPDLAERMLRIDCPILEPSQRIPDSEVARLLSECRPGAFSELLDLVVAVRRAIPGLATATELPRLADFAQILRALDEVRGTCSYERYKQVASESVTETLVDDPVAESITALVSDGEWRGTADELLDRIQPGSYVTGVPTGFPTSAKAMGQWLSRNEKSLCARGIRHAAWRTNTDRYHSLQRVTNSDVLGGQERSDGPAIAPVHSNA